ncbi:MAG TPA: hypothetical protein VJJ79_02700 [Candidatus Nanoarchaeia archaeon]|nr:hypothetical protein [Candidatus Nanoarchaeia archaeon]
MRRKKVLFVLGIVLVLIFLFLYVVFEKEINAGISLFEIDPEHQLVLFPFSNRESETLAMDEIILASLYDAQHILQSTTFTEESDLYFIMANVSGLSVQQDGSSWYDVDVQVLRHADNATVLSLEKNLGEKGKRVLNSKTISPYGLVNIPWTADSGNYTVAITFYDLYANISLERNATFTLVNSYEGISIPEPMLG